MDIKKSNVVISIAFFASACCGGSGSTDGMTELCLKDALAGGPASVMVETYDRRYYRSRGPRIRTCVISHYCGDTTIEPLARVWPIDVATAAASVWHFVRYEIAPNFRHWEIGESFCALDKDFAYYSPGKFNVGDVASTNISLHVFPFVVKNPASKNTLFCCRVSLMGPKGFICALYVNLNTGDIGMTFGEASGHLPLVVRESQYPFLYEDEIAKQEKFIERTRHPVSKKKRREDIMRELVTDRKADKDMRASPRKKSFSGSDVKDVEVELADPCPPPNGR